MAKRAVPMIHVPDVPAAVDWYVSMTGFKVVDQGDLEGEVVWAMLSYGESFVMFNKGGAPSKEKRREVDLYVYVENIEELYKRIKDKAEVVEHLSESFYGMREFIIRDLNRFWITFGEPVNK
jgi:uncharacterized glyoxalase superfamily protein PhnB